LKNHEGSKNDARATSDTKKRENVGKRLLKLEEPDWRAREIVEKNEAEIPLAHSWRLIEVDGGKVPLKKGFLYEVRLLVSDNQDKKEGKSRDSKDRYTKDRREVGGRGVGGGVQTRNSRL